MKYRTFVRLRSRRLPFLFYAPLFDLCSSRLNCWYSRVFSCPTCPSTVLIKELNFINQFILVLLGSLFVLRKLAKGSGFSRRVLLVLFPAVVWIESVCGSFRPPSQRSQGHRRLILCLMPPMCVDLWDIRRLLYSPFVSTCLRWVLSIYI